MTQSQSSLTLQMFKLSCNSYMLIKKKPIGYTMEDVHIKLIKFETYFSL